MTIAYAEHATMRPSAFFAAPDSAGLGGSTAKRAVSAAFFVAVVAGTTATAPVAHDFTQIVMRRCTVADAVTVPAVPTTRDSRSDTEVTQWLKSSSGLTWDQLARVFGVSRRTVHLWANGGRINAANAEALREFAAIVAQHKGTAADVTRAALLEVGADGRSLIDRFRSSRDDRASDVSGVFTPNELLGGES